MRNTFSVFAVLLLLAGPVKGQELQARLTVMAGRVSTQVDKKTFQTLQTALTNFINNRKWTTDAFQPQEKIKCNFLLSIDQDMGQNVYKASLTVQAARPVYNSTYESPLINFQDQDIVFKYIEFQPVEFNENRVQGSDALSANLTAVLAYYINIILGMDYDSFGPKGGDPYFQKASFIVNNAPESSQISGWKAFDGLRNRFKLSEGFTDNRFNLVHDAIYAYYRNGLDQFYENDAVGRTGMLKALNYLNTVNTENPGSMVLQFFFQGKSNELVKAFSKADQKTKVQAREILSKLDITNVNAYKELK
ncbi:MAG: type IX secretion system protein PorD [Flavisolibacter sp.]